jgi:DNA-binding CsgD family transcriptional regulator
MSEATSGRYDVDIVHALLGRSRPSAERPAPSAVGSLLSEREREILRWISFGASNKVVAQKLGISPSTVRTHVENTFRKLECSTRAAATLKATQLGLL